MEELAPELGQKVAWAIRETYRSHGYITRINTLVMGSADWIIDS